jgi:transcription termination factor Rho
MHPDEQLRLECGRTLRGQTDYTNRVIDLFCPLGKGQRAMIVAPAKAGKTMVLQAIAPWLPVHREAFASPGSSTGTGPSMLARCPWRSRPVNR